MKADWKSIKDCGFPDKSGWYIVTLHRYQSFSKLTYVEVVWFSQASGEFHTKDYDNDLVPSEVIAYDTCPQPYLEKDDE